MNGACGIPETLAQKRIYIGTLPGMSEETKRELECLTLHAADLLPAEVPWQGLSSSGILLETPSHQMVPFSPFDPSLGDANMLIMAKSGGGKTFMAQLLLLMLGRTGVEISILERGDSYRPLVELMGGRVIEVNLDGNETLNPWDLPEGEKTPSKEKIAFLKNLTRHMIGDAPGSDTTLVDNVISEAIGRTYKRVGLRYANPVPTFSDLRDELAQWQDEEKMQRAVDEAKLAAIKLRTWTDKGIYSRLFDRHTNIRTDNNWLFFNVEGLGSDPHLETAMSMLIANAMAERASGKSGQASITVLENQLHLNDVALAAIKRFTSPQKGRYAEMLLVIGEKSETTQTVRLVPTPIDYWICTTYPRERAYRAWFLRRIPDQPLLECYEELARKYPQGLAGLPQLPEELSGAVHAIEAVRV